MKRLRLFAIILVVVMMFQAMPFTIASAAANDTIVLYPEYPEKIEKDYMYTVYVSQGGEEYEIPVYNSMRHANHYVRGDLGTYSEADRRFCQFSANPSSTNPVTITIVANTDFHKYSIIPSTKKIASTVTSNRITFNITQSGQYVFRLNDDNVTNLAIFADAVETDVPDKNASNVVVFNKDNPAPNVIGTYKSGGKYYPAKTIFYVEDWQDVEFFELQTTQQLYIAPGAVLNARVEVMQNNSNIKIFGRGMLRDFNDTRAYNSGKELSSDRQFNYLLTIGSSWDGRKNAQCAADKVEIKDILLFDAKGFNLVFQGATNCTADNIKIVANEISTDGISVWASRNITVKNSFLHVADNVFVFDQSETLTVDNILVGSSISIFYPQGNIFGIQKFTNINLFRAGTIFEPAGGVKREWEYCNMIVDTLSAVDCVAPYGSSTRNKTGKLISTGDNAWESATTKPITLRNISLPDDAVSYIVEVGVQNGSAGNYDITLKNVYAGTNALTYSNVQFNDATTSGKPSTITVTNDGTYTPVTKNETIASYSGYNTYLRDVSSGLKYYSPTQPYAKNGTMYVSANAVAEKLGFETYFDEDDKSLTIYDEDVIVRATVGTDTVLYNDITVTLTTPVEYGTEVMVPVEFFQKTIAPQTKVTDKNIVIGGYNRGEDSNLVENGDFEDKNALEDWTTINFARLTRSTIAHSGSYGLRMADKSQFINTKSYQGLYQDVRETVRQNGPGVYEIKFWAKCNDTSVDLTNTSSYNLFTTIRTGWMGATPPKGITAQALSTSWKEYTQRVFISESSATNLVEMYAAITVNGTLDVSVDDFSFAKVSDVTYTGGVPYFDITTTATNNSMSYGGGSKTVTISGADTGIPTINYETNNDYITVSSTTHTGSGSSSNPYKATATVEVKYPSNYERTARIIARGGSGTVVGEIVITIPAHTTDVRHVLDYDCNLVVKESYKYGETLDTSALKLTNVKYNDGTIGTVNSSDVTITGADFTTAGEKTVTVTYDNKSVTYKTTVKPIYDVEINILGANIRIETDEYSAGIRFGAMVSKDNIYDKYYPTTDEEKKYKYDENNNYQFGVIMIPKKHVPEGSSVVEMYKSGATNVLDILGEKVYQQNETTLAFTGVLTGIPQTNYTDTLQCAFYVRVREDAESEWKYSYSATVDDSYFSVAERAYYNAYNYGKIENPTAEEKAVIDALTEILDFVEKDLWIDYWA